MIQKHFCMSLISYFFRKSLCTFHGIHDHTNAAAMLYNILNHCQNSIFCTWVHLNMRMCSLIRQSFLPDLSSVRPRQKRIPHFVFKGLFGFSDSEVCTNQRHSPACRKRRGQQDHRRFIVPQPLESHFQIFVHVRIICMHFIDHDYFFRQAHVQKHHMLSLQCHHQHLIHRCNDKVGKTGFLVIAEPAVHDQSAVRFLFRYPSLDFLKAGIQSGTAMFQLNGMVEILGLLFAPLHHAGKNAVRSCLCRQPEKHTVFPAFRSEDFCSGKGSLRLSAPHGSLKNTDSR